LGGDRSIQFKTRAKCGLLWYVPWVLVASILPARAERSYVTDECTVPVQSGAAPAYRIVRMVGSGTPLEILQPSTQGYTKVKTPEGTVGWIATQYLTDQPSARSRIGPLEARVAALEEENRVLRGEAETLDAARTAATRCSDELATIRRTAAQALAIDEENRQLQQEIAAVRERQQQLEVENHDAAQSVSPPLVSCRRRGRPGRPAVWSDHPAPLLAAAAATLGTVLSLSPESGIMADPPGGCAAWRHPA
jgi:SH3 domain protein